MDYEILASTVLFRIDDPTQHAPMTVTVSYGDTVLSRADMGRICDTMCRQTLGRKTKSQRNLPQYFLKP
ncbi:hypothetical protein P3T16_006162 [Paraburkholderia sp. GAS42]